jgi:hypothetical protein
MNLKFKISNSKSAPLFVYLSICLLVYFVYPRSASAINMNSNEYRIQFGKVDSGGGKMDDLVNDSYHLTSSIGQEAAKEFQSTGYIVKSGFQYIYSRVPFTFSLSTIQVDLGTLIPSVPSSGTITLKVSFGGAGQYVVTALPAEPLTNYTGTSTIPFTGCDGGIDTCTTTTAKLWTSTSAYGFGYGMTGQDIPADFINSTYYRPFPNSLLSEAPATIMQSSNVTADITPTPAVPYTPAPALTGVPRNTTHQAVITMKANVSTLQAAGAYKTVLRFLATPSF